MTIIPVTGSRLSGRACLGPFLLLGRHTRHIVTVARKVPAVVTIGEIIGTLPCRETADTLLHGLWKGELAGSVMRDGLVQLITACRAGSNYTPY